MTTLTPFNNPAQDNAPVLANENFAAVSPVAIFAKRPTATGLNWHYYGGEMLVDGVLTSIANGTVALTGSATNYVEATRAGAVSANTTGFTAGRIPLYELVTSASQVTGTTDRRAWVQPAGVDGRLSLSVAGAANVTLTAAQARNDILNFTGLLTGSINVIVPDGPQMWTVTNNTTGAFSVTIKTSAGTGIAVTQGKSLDVAADGTNVIATNNDTAGAGVGDVVGPASSTNGNIAQFDGASGKLLKDTGLGIDTDTALGANSDLKIATQKAVKAYIDSLGLAGFKYLIDTGSTAASDPGAGLFKFNHATLLLVTELYVDDSTSDAVDLSTLLASLGSSGLVKITSTRDDGEWVVFKWTATPTDNTGWWTFTVVHQAGLGTFEDDDEVQVLFLQLGASAGGITDGDKGDITVSGSGTVFTIDPAVVTLAKIANAAANNKLLGAGAAGSGASYAEITLGTNLSMSGTTLNAAGGGSASDGDAVVRRLYINGSI